MTVLNQGYYRSRGHYPPGGSAERCCSQSHCPCASLTTAIRIALEGKEYVVKDGDVLRFRFAN